MLEQQRWEYAERARDRGWRKRVIFMRKTIFALAGIGLLALAIWSTVMTANFRFHAKATEGTVMRLNAGGSHPQIEFTTGEGQKVSYPQGGLIFGYHPGDRVRVLYLAAEPDKAACLDVFGALWFAPMLLAFLGAAFILGSRW
jgi:hypothetical protein